MRSGIGNSAIDPIFVTGVVAGGTTPPSGTVADPTFQKAVGSASIATAQIAAPTGTSAQIVAARAGRTAVTITNITGAQQVYVGASGVTAATGQLLPATVGASVTIPTQAAIFGISLTAAQTVSILETF